MRRMRLSAWRLTGAGADVETAPDQSIAASMVLISEISAVCDVTMLFASFFAAASLPPDCSCFAMSTAP